MLNKGNEYYSVVEGLACMHFGKVAKNSLVEKWHKLNVKAGDAFKIPEGYAHQLRNLEQGRALIILFGCPDSHLSDDEDRYLLADAPD